MSSNTDLSLEALGLTSQHSPKDLESAIMKKVSLNQKNICEILNTANLHDLDKLRDACHQFMDKNASEIVANECFNHLTQKSMIKLLERDTFYVPEIEMFKRVSGWCKVNNDTDNLVINSVRLCWLTVEDILSIVWPSKLVNCEKLLQAMAEIVDLKPKTSRSRGILVMDENIATPEHNAEEITHNRTVLLFGNRDVDRYSHFNIDGRSNITIKLRGPSYINHIKMGLWDKELRNYSYHIDVSIDRKNWVKVIDHTKYLCRSLQSLYFEQVNAQYIRIVGIRAPLSPIFQLVFAEVYCKTNIPKIVQGLICPSTNIVTYAKKTVIIEGEKAYYILDESTKDYTKNLGYSFHTIGRGCIIIQFPQPYMIGSMKLLLWDPDNRSYKYFIETSANKSDWEIVVDRRNEECKSWQTLHFEERPVVFIKITGTYTSVGDKFRCDHFECPASPDAT